MAYARRRDAWQFEGISSFSAGLGRLSTFVERMESYQAGGASQATFRLSADHLARLSPAAELEEPTLWELIRYGTQGPPPKPPPKPPSLTEADVEVDAEGRSLWDVVRYGQKGPPSTTAAAASSSALSSLTGVVMPTLPNRIANHEVEVVPNGLALAVRDMSLSTPDGTRQLFANVSVDVQPGNHLLIMGNSGAGKSSMLRAVAGLWTCGSGEVYRPPIGQTMFLPQRPYCTLGSLRQQLVYPRTVDEWARTSTDEALLRALRTVQLARLAETGAVGLDVVRDWGDELSLGEQQRLAFARVLVNKPRMAILDEATSALDLRNEQVMYSALARTPGITYISVGHRPSLLRYHSSRLRLFGMEQSPSYVVEAIDEQLAASEAAIEALLPE